MIVLEKGVRLLLWLSWVAAASGVAGAAVPTGHDLAQAHLGSVRYLRQIGADAWEGEEAQSVVLAEAMLADPYVLGRRSAPYLSSLELHAIDARGRRLLALNALGLDVSKDSDALLATLSLPHGDPLDLLVLVKRYSINYRSGYGRSGTRIPTALDNAIAIQALNAAGLGDEPAVDYAMAYLFEFQLTDGSWSNTLHGDTALENPVGDIGVTAQAVLALVPHDGTSLEIPLGNWIATNDDWGFNVDPSVALDDAVAHLKTAVPDNPSEAALRILAVLAREPDWDGLGSALEELVTYSDPDFSFGGSAYATALAARAIRKASEVEDFAFDTDGDGRTDDVDPDSDNDGYCDPGEEGDALDPCSGTDAFPLDLQEHSDLDNDGVGDDADEDKDGDGVLDIEEDPGRETDAQESADFDGDGLGDTADPDDDGDGLPDVEELLEGLDPRDPDTDGDEYDDHVEVVLGTDGLDPTDYPPLPDGDIFPLGNPDGVVDGRDAVLAFRIASGEVALPTGDDWIRFIWHGNVAPLQMGEPALLDEQFNAADAVVILRLVSEAQSPW